MVNTSWPAVGENGFSDAQYRISRADSDGIVNDLTGTAAALTRINAGDLARIAPFTAELDGFTFQATENNDLYLAPASGTVVTYRICLTYDPALNVEGAGGLADPAGPCRLAVITGNIPNDARSYLLLHTVSRSPNQLLTAAPASDFRRAKANTVFVPELRGETKGYTDFPLGTIMIEEGTGLQSLRTRYRVRNPATPGTLMWADSRRGTWIPFPAPTGLIAYDRAPQYMIRPDGWVMFRGTLARTSGNRLNTPGANVVLGTMPDGAKPSGVRRLICNGQFGKAVGVAVDSQGLVYMYDPETTIGNVNFVDLSNLTYEAE